MSDASFQQLLVQAGIITRSQLQCALAFQRGWEGRLGLEQALVKLGLLSRRAVLLVRSGEASGSDGGIPQSVAARGVD